MSTVIQDNKNEIAEFDEFRAKLEEFKNRYEGEGYVRGGDDVDCYRCSGTGKVYNNARVTLSHRKIKVDVDWRLLQRFADLPNVEIALQERYSPVVIRFDGGRGLLMPLRDRADVF